MAFVHPAPQQYVFVEKKAAEHGGYAVITLKRNPVNGMNRDFWQQLEQTLADCEADKDIRGVIYWSGLSKPIFTAGNDINELYTPHTNKQRHREFWVAQTNFLARLYRSPLITVAAVRGACPAGGCVLAMCCDVRIITEEGTMGLNEVALGIVPPPYWAKVMQKIIGDQVAENALMAATMFTAKQALTIGLVDEVTAADQLMPTAEKHLSKYLKLPDSGRQVVKNFQREQLAKDWEAQAVMEHKLGWYNLTSEDTVASLGKVLARLSGKKPSKL